MTNVSRMDITRRSDELNPFIRPPGPPQQDLALSILFVGISKSTELFDFYGDEQAREIIARTLSILRDVTEKRGGRIIKTMGDEIMCTLSNFGDAVKTAFAMQKTILKNETLSHFNIGIRIGLNQGEVLLEKKDIYGDAVIIASSLARLAKSNQIFATRKMIDTLPAALQERTRSYGKIQLQENSEKIEIVEINWLDDSPNLAMVSEIFRSSPSMISPKVFLRFGNQSFEISEENPAIVLGRDEQNDVDLNLDFVSRKHATIEFRHNRFFLVDQSTNGTYVCANNGQPYFIQRDQIQIQRRGIFSLGREIRKNKGNLIYYKCSGETFRG